MIGFAWLLPNSVVSWTENSPKTPVLWSRGPPIYGHENICSWWNMVHIYIYMYMVLLYIWLIIYVYSNYIYMYIFIFIYTSFHSIWGCRIWDNSIFDCLVVIVAHITRGRLNDCFLAVILKLITSCGFHLATQILGELEQSSEAWVENRIPSGYD